MESERFSPPRPRKRFGQHFLKNPGAIRRIIAAARLSTDDVVVEIGPGMGALTVALAASCGKVLAVELDRDLAPLLEAKLADGRISNVAVIQQDILRFDFASQAREHGGKKLKVLGNLPYNISTPLLFRLIEARGAIGVAVLMFQREVAQRIVARPGGKEYGALSVLVQYSASVETVMDLDPGDFKPPPKVRSRVVRLTFLDEPQVAARDEDWFRKVVKASFAHRRKTLANALKSLDIAPEVLLPVLEGMGLGPKVRGEKLNLKQFVALSDGLLS